jgi:hypothetical protein
VNERDRFLIRFLLRESVREKTFAGYCHSMDISMEYNLWAIYILT